MKVALVPTHSHLQPTRAHTVRAKRKEPARSPQRLRIPQRPPGPLPAAPRSFAEAGRALAHRSNSMQYWSVPEAPGPLAAATLCPDPAGPGSPGSRRTRAHRSRGGRRRQRLGTPRRSGPHTEPSVEVAITPTSRALRPCAVGAPPRHTPPRRIHTHSSQRREDGL